MSYPSLEDYDTIEEYEDAVDAYEYAEFREEERAKEDYYERKYGC